MDGKSISKILEDSLDFIDAEISESSPQGELVSSSSASSLLLNQKKKLKRTVDSEDFVPFNRPSKRQTIVTPLLAQISDSTLEPPKYWNSGQVPTSKTKPALLGKNSKKLRQRKKGEEYSGKLSAKLVARGKKSKLRATAKNS